MDVATLAEAKSMDGYLGHEFASSEDGTVFMSYWRDEEAVSEWAKTHHRRAKAQSRNGTPPAPSFARSSGTVCQNPEFRTYPTWFVGNSRLSFMSCLHMRLIFKAFIK